MSEWQQLELNNRCYCLIYVQHINLNINILWTGTAPHCSPIVLAPLHIKLSLHTQHSLTHINIFQNTKLFRSWTLNPKGMFPLNQRGKWLTRLTPPYCPAFKMGLSNVPLPSSSAHTIKFSSASIYFELIHFSPLSHWGNIVPVCVMEKPGCITPLADFRMKMLH